MSILIGIVAGLLVFTCPLAIGILVSIFVMAIFRRWSKKIWPSEFEKTPRKSTETLG